MRKLRLKKYTSEIKHLGDGFLCPFCGSPDIKPDFDEAGYWTEDGNLIAPVSCEDCMEAWEELYKIIDRRTLNSHTKLPF